MGLTSEGFSPKSLQEIRDDISESLRLKLGQDIDTSASSRIGQFVDIVSDEIYDVWLGLQDTYNSFYPDTASGTSLDNVVAITNTVRKPATNSSSDVYFGGDVGTVIPSGSQFQKNDTTDRFATTVDATIVDTSTLLLSPTVADAGTITLSWDAEAIAPISFSDDVVTIKGKIEAHSKIQLATVTGGFNTLGGIHILLNTDTLTSRLTTIDDQDLTNGGNPIVVDSDYSTNEVNTLTAVETGAVTVPALSIRTIVTPTIGLNEVVNFDVGITGSERETDAELRARRQVELQKAGTTTLGGMKEAVEQVPNVENVTIIENDTSVTDGDGRPPHSFEVFVTHPNNQENRDNIAQAIYNTKPVGIGNVSTVAAPNQREGNIIDVNDVATTLTYSAPDTVAINLIVNLTLSSASEGVTYPTDGDQQVRDALAAYFATLELGNDVKNHLLYTPVNTVPGIETIEILQAEKPTVPVFTTNIPISVTEVAVIEVPNTDIVVNS